MLNRILSFLFCAVMFTACSDDPQPSGPTGPGGGGNGGGNNNDTTKPAAVGSTFHYLAEKEGFRDTLTLTLGATGTTKNGKSNVHRFDFPAGAAWYFAMEPNGDIAHLMLLATDSTRWETFPIKSKQEVVLPAFVTTYSSHREEMRDSISYRGQDSIEVGGKKYLGEKIEVRRNTRYVSPGNVEFLNNTSVYTWTWSPSLRAILNWNHDLTPAPYNLVSMSLK
jgi:hypothetical protein